MLREESIQLAARRAALERSAAQREAGLERMLVARHAAGAAEPVRVLLSGDAPAEVSRRLHYVSYVSRAAADALGAFRADIADLEALAREAQARRARLEEIEQASRADRESILRERRERRRVFERLAAEIRKSRREIGVLRADEARLTQLVREIGRVVYARVQRTPEPSTGNPAFSALRGKLRLPVSGELTGRFGAPRGAVGAEAKGVFIRAPEGQPARAVAAGRVVFADWMRGFGNLLIVDHGEAYLSIYANAEALLKQVGDGVAAGEPVATTGATGGNEESGLYFEMRHLGRAFDPLRWVKLK